MSCNWSHAAKYGSFESKRRRIPSSIRDDTVPNCACSTQCRLAYPANGKLSSALLLFELPSNWSRVPKQAWARVVCAGSGMIWKSEASPFEVARRLEVKNSFTEKCE